MQPQGNCFISCSLRPVDQPFVDFIVQIVRAHNLQPFGTVGKFSAAPISTAELIKQNIPKADIIVIAATPRYFQQDLQSRRTSSGLSEMLHVEAAMAYALNKPVIVLAQKGTDVGNFLPNITQYIYLDGSQEDFARQWTLIQSLFTNAISIAQKIREQTSTRNFGKFLTGGLAAFGLFKMIESIDESEEPAQPARRKKYNPRNKSGATMKKPVQKKYKSN
jgi:hypothetical protein